MSTDSDILELVAKDTVLPVEEQDKDWVQVTLANDVTGYIAADYITVAESYDFSARTRTVSSVTVPSTFL